MADFGHDRSPDGALRRTIAAMSVTIRDYIKKRVRWCFAIAAAGWLLIALGSAFAQQLPAGFPQFLVPLLGGLLFGGAILAMQGVVKCPKCRANLGRTIAMPVAMSFGSGPKINFCPYCGVHLDQPRIAAQQPASSQNPIK